MKTEHTLWLDAYYEVVAIASSPGWPLVESQIDAYKALPDLIDQCQKAWLALPEPDRPSHYLLYV